MQRAKLRPINGNRDEIVPGSTAPQYAAIGTWKGYLTARRHPSELEAPSVRLRRQGSATVRGLQECESAAEVLELTESCKGNERGVRRHRAFGEGQAGRTARVEHFGGLHPEIERIFVFLRHWAKQGVRVCLFEALATGSLGSLHLLDSSVVRAHQHAAGGKKGVRITPSDAREAG